MEDYTINILDFHPAQRFVAECPYCNKIVETHNLTIGECVRCEGCCRTLKIQNGDK